MSTYADAEDLAKIRDAISEAHQKVFEARNAIQHARNVANEIARYELGSELPAHPVPRLDDAKDHADETLRRMLNLEQDFAGVAS